MEEYSPEIKLFKGDKKSVSCREDVLLVNDEHLLSDSEIEEVKVYSKSYTLVVVHKTIQRQSDGKVDVHRRITVKSGGFRGRWMLPYADENAPIELWSDKAQYRIFARYKTNRGKYEILSLHTDVSSILSVGPFSEKESNNILKTLKTSKNPA